MGRYDTRQYRTVLGFFEKNRNAHFTASQVALQLERDGEHIGRTTVYRQLERLFEDGRVRRFEGTDAGGCCYQLAGGEECRNHYHLKCLVCGKLIHTECEFLDELENHVFEHHRFRISGEKTVLYGVCEECR